MLMRNSRGLPKKEKEMDITSIIIKLEIYQDLSPRKIKAILIICLMHCLYILIRKGMAFRLKKNQNKKERNSHSNFRTNELNCLRAIQMHSKQFILFTFSSVFQVFAKKIIVLI